MENYGHAGDLYAKWLVDNLEEAKNAVKRIQAKIDKEFNLTQRERNWSAVIAANLAGGLIAKNQLGLIDWDMTVIYDWASKMVDGMRGEVVAPVSDASAVIGDYIDRYIQNCLVVNDAVDRRNNMVELPKQEPKGELLIRYEPDTNKVFIASKPFKDHCVKYQINYKDTLEQLRAKGMLLGPGQKRMAKGMAMISTNTPVLIFNASHKDFISIDALIGTEKVDAGGGG